MAANSERRNPRFLTPGTKTEERKPHGKRWRSAIGKGKGKSSSWVVPLAHFGAVLALATASM